jgi:hypothetical protein
LQNRKIEEARVQELRKWERRNTNIIKSQRRGVVVNLQNPDNGTGKERRETYNCGQRALLAFISWNLRGFDT